MLSQLGQELSKEARQRSVSIKGIHRTNIQITLLELLTPPNGTKWLSESQVPQKKKMKRKKMLLSESACAKASRSRHLEPTPWRN